MDGANRRTVAGPTRNIWSLEYCVEAIFTMVEKGAWEIVFGALAQDDPDLEYVSIDGTIVRAHQHSAGGKGGLNSAVKNLLWVVL